MESINAKTGMTPAEPREFIRNHIGNVNFAESSPNAVAIFTALQDQLGLNLESARGPVRFLVIDRGGFL